MKAICYHRYGPPDVLHILDIARPKPGPNEILVKVHYSGLLPYDWRYMRAKPFAVRAISGLLAPKRKTLGLDFSGTIEAVGDEIVQFQIGDEVFGLAPEAFAEYVLANEHQIVIKPKNLSFEHASISPGSAFTALQCLRDHGHIQEGQKVLINGASGGVGTFAVQLAKYFGAEVTGVCSGRNIELVRSIGANDVLNYEEYNITENCYQYDLIIDAVGNHSIAEFKKMLKPQGRYVAAAGSLPRMLWLTLPGRKKLRSMLGRPNPQDLEFISNLLAGNSLTPVLDQSFPLECVKEAVAYLETGRVRGKITLKISNS